MPEDIELNCRLASWAESIKRRIGMQVGIVRSRDQQDAQRNIIAVKEMAETRVRRVSNTQRTISAGGIYGTQKQRQLRDDACAGDRSIWLFRTNWMT